MICHGGMYEADAKFAGRWIVSDLLQSADKRILRTGLDDAEKRELPDSLAYLLHPLLTKWLSPEQRSNVQVVGDQLPYHNDQWQ